MVKLKILTWLRNLSAVFFGSIWIILSTWLIAWGLDHLNWFINSMIVGAFFFGEALILNAFLRKWNEVIEQQKLIIRIKIPVYYRRPQKITKKTKH